MLFAKGMFIVFISACFVALFVFVIVSGKVDERAEPLRLPDNRIVIEGAHIIRSYADGYMELTADTAYYDKNTDTLTFSAFDLAHKTNSINVTAIADTGIYVPGISFQATGNIKGLYNNMSYQSGDNGRLYYDFVKGLGNMTGSDLLFVQDGSNIRASRVQYNTKNRSADFENISVFYGGS